MRLSEQVAVISGGSGIVGSGIVRVYLEEGATVIAPVRSLASKQELVDEVLLNIDGAAASRLNVPILDFTTDQGMKELTELIASTTKSGQIDHVVSCFGGDFKMGPISSLTPEDLHTALDRAVPHLLLSQALLPLMKQEAMSSYIVVTGLLGEKCLMPNAAGLTVANATIFGVVRAMEGENAEKPFRINELRIGAMIRKDSKPGHPFVKQGKAYSAKLIGQEAADIAAGTQKSQIIRITSDDLAAKEHMGVKEGVIERIPEMMAA